ncbi:MAG: hypothetical protein NTY34_07615 [Candidatus Omnitrophica bacterium]|nr:hypothetical protein [Candidatus Omnitrophota bacterium]
MSKKKWSGILAVFFLVQSIMLPPMASAVNYPLTQIKTDSNYPDGYFKKTYDFIRFGLLLYKLDAIGRSSKEDLISNAGKMILSPGISFDLDNIDVVRKGWTRYYPFSIDGKDFIMRIFLTAERSYQPEAPILYEGSITNPAVTFQVLPSINEIISGCKIQPRRTYSSAEVNRSS